MLAKYAGFSPARMRAEADVLSRELLDLTAPVYQKMFDMGHYEIVGYVLDGSLPIPTEDDELLTQYRVEHESVGGAVKRVELRPEEFPHEYSLRHEIDWLKGNERDALK